jgi:carbon-monoxide dehydrogenase large subunit
MNAPDTSVVGRYGSGRAVLRTEDDNLLRGQGRFTDDLAMADGAVLMFLRSPYAHARIVSIDAAAARSAPGVFAVYTGADLLAAGVKPLPGVPFKRPDGSPAVTPLRHALAVDRVRHVGEAVAAVVAATREQARDALELIALDLDALPAVTDLHAALAPEAPRVAEGAPDNLCARASYGNRAAADAAFAAAAHVVTLQLVNQRLAAAPIEPRTIVAHVDPATGRLFVELSTQMPGGARNTFADLLPGASKESVRVLVHDVGGGFGLKTGIHSEDLAVAYAALALKRPVRWVAERNEEMLASRHGRDIASTASLALDAQGRVLAYRLRTLANVGAYAGATGVAIQLMIGPWVATSVYDIGTIDFEFDAVLTHTMSTGAYRGAGRPEAIYITERLMDAAAAKLGLDPAEIRRRNLIAPTQMPYTNAMAQTYDCGAFERMLDAGLAAADWAGFAVRERASRAAGRLRGRGLVTFLEWTGGNVFEERVLVTVSADGFIELVLATQAMGQGLATTYAQLAVDVFEVPIERIRIRQGDTDLVTGFGSAGSRSLFTGGPALQVAARRTIDAARPLAADRLEVRAADLEYARGAFRVVGTDRAVSLFDVAAGQPRAQLFTDSTSSVEGPTWPNGCHVCEVEIDPDTGEVQVSRYVSVNDIGRVVNPLIVEGQLEGGAVQGIGQALCEEMIYDPDSGQLLTGTFMDYAMPRADSYGTFDTRFDESVPARNNPLGVKGVGELGTIGATPVVVNAVVDALRRAGVPDEVALSLQMPLTAPKVWAALARARRG